MPLATQRLRTSIASAMSRVSQDVRRRVLGLHRSPLGAGVRTRKTARVQWSALVARLSVGGLRRRHVDLAARALRTQPAAIGDHAIGRLARCLLGDQDAGRMDVKVAVPHPLPTG